MLRGYRYFSTAVAIMLFGAVLLFSSCPNDDQSKEVRDQSEKTDIFGAPITDDQVIRGDATDEGDRAIDVPDYSQDRIDLENLKDDFYQVGPEKPFVPPEITAYA